MKQFFCGLGRIALLVLLVGDLINGLHAQSSSSVITAGSEATPSAPINSQPQSPVVTVSKPATQSTQDLTAPAMKSTPMAPATEGPAQGGNQATVNGDYVLRGGDTIEMIVYREQDLSIRSKIGKDGMVQIPLLGEVKIGGLTVRAATSLIRARYNADYLVEPQVYLNVSAYKSTKFTIIGQVNKPGTYEYSESEPLGLLEAIGMAGGFTRIADRGHVIVKRREGDKVRTNKVNAKKLTDSGVDQFLIQSGDVINIGESWY
jgi:polysaccharide export outer membrane protein